MSEIILRDGGEIVQEDRSLEEIAQSILRTKAKVQREVVEGFAQMGRDLKEAKSKVPYGEWGRWLAENVNFSERHAQDLMRIADEYNEHMSDSLMSLSITQATALLGLTAEQKEEFVATHDMEAITTDELKAKVKELKEQLTGKQQTIDGLMEEVAQLSTADTDSEAEKELAELHAQLRAAEERAAEAEAKAAEKAEDAVQARMKLGDGEQARIDAKAEATKARQEKAQLETKLQAYKQRAEVAERQKELTEEQLLEERSKGPRVEYQTPPEVAQELARLRAEAGRGESQIMVRKLIGDISRTTGPLESELGKVAREDKETGKKMMMAAAKIFLDLGEKLKNMAEGMGE